jgi:hypothetical protein
MCSWDNGATNGWMFGFSRHKKKKHRERTNEQQDQNDPRT